MSARSVMVPPGAPDQAAGLRRLFARTPQRFVPVVANPNLGNGSALLERLCTAIGELDLHTLLVDASDAGSSRPAAYPLAGVESLSPSLSYLDLRGAFTPSHETALLEADGLLTLAESAPDADIVLVHARADALAGLFSPLPRAGMMPHVLLLCDEQPTAITSAYAGLKLLATKAGMRAHDLLLGAAEDSDRAPLVAERLAQCARHFVGGTQRRWASVDVSMADDRVPDTLRRMVDELLAAAWLADGSLWPDCRANRPSAWPVSPVDDIQAVGF